MTSESPSARRRRHAGRVSAWVLGGLLLLVIIGGVWIGVRGILAYQHLDNARTSAAGAAEVLADPAKAPALIERISVDTSAARVLTDDIIWRAGEQLPWIGPQLAAVSTVSSALDDVASHALDPLATVASTFSLDSIRPQNGAIDVSLFADIAPAALSSTEALDNARDDIAGIDTTVLLGPVRDAVAQVSGLVTEAYTGVDAVRRASTLMPAMLGADGPRDYLIVFQNNAEWRSLGGIVGAMLQLHTDNGRLTLTAQGSSEDFPAYEATVMPLSSEEEQIFGAQPARWVQNVTQIPDFTRGAPIAREMWLREKGVDVDGVISLDPVALSYVLEATGPVSLPTGDTLTSANAVDLLLNGVYQRYEQPREQDAFFAAAASAVFASLTSGTASPSDLLSSMARAGYENRLLLWSADAAEQAVLDGTSLQGALPETDAEVTSFGVYANDATASKMDYYQSLETVTTWCGADRGQLTVTIRNDAPSDAANLPTYITGGGSHGVPPGEIKTVTYVYLPQDSTLVSSTAAGDRESSGFGTGIDADRDVLIWTTQLAPGESMTLTVQVRTPRTPQIVTRSTPTIDIPAIPRIASGCDIPG
ncbi:MAG: DUF4012 domain-containing protein [Microbacterium sp.]|uniref:DUF4012 domain-containing protein n=1 Tax=Microbacterium sp. TaxID=51671 RepID=UPI001D6D2028|nr:DUF4012 domain-containing protein [Microbacterium sp.]MBW8761787.1 DUF4012 domain-containing protein [Microbacterium sp.]